MKSILLILAAALVAGSHATAQFGNFGDNPVEIESEYKRFEMGVAIAEQNVVISYAGTTIYCDYAEYSVDTRDVLVRGNVRIYREGQSFTADRGFYNLETKVFRTANFKGESSAFRFGGDSLGSLARNEYKVGNGVFTTSDSSEPDYQIKAKSIRIYPGDRVIFRDATFYIGRTPIFYFPYLYQSLDKSFTYSVIPGFTSRWGAFVKTHFGFPLTESIHGDLRLDYRQKRGPGIGFDAESRFGNGSWAHFRSYYTHDSATDINPTAIPRGQIDSERYRISLQSRVYLSEDLYATVDFNKLSDWKFLEDFEPNEFRVDPQPDNVATLTKREENYTATLVGRFAVNSFFQTTERLPELVVDFKRSPLFESPVFYEGQTGIAKLRRSFEDLSVSPDYESLRLDSFHQLLFPHTYGGWLSFVPRIGGRATYYDKTGTFEDTIEIEDFETKLLDGSVAKLQREVAGKRLISGGSKFRPVFNAGFESSFKFSREFETVQSRAWGLDGLRHIVQPYTNFSYVWSPEDPYDILQFDRYIPSTQLQPIDMTGFNTIDALNNWTVWRLGFRNRLQTRRDNQTFNWLELDTYFDANLDSPHFPGVTDSSGSFSNVFNNLRWTPLPWLSLNLDSQLPLLASGFTQINTRANFMVNSNLLLNLGNRYIHGNPYFRDSNQATIGGYLRLNENWGLSTQERYEFADSTLESQRYTVHRDLSSWIASLGFFVHNNRTKDEYGILLSFTLKDFPEANIPFSFDPTGFE